MDRRRIIARQAAKFDEKVFILAGLLREDVESTRDEFLTWVKTVPLPISTGLDFCIRRAQSGVPVQWGEEDG